MGHVYSEEICVYSDTANDEKIVVFLIFQFPVSTMLVVLCNVKINIFEPGPERTCVRFVFTLKYHWAAW
jgi:hypothetical protein